MRLLVVTGNPGKAREVESYLSPLIEVVHVALSCPEFRDSDVRVIAREKARYAYERLGKPLIVDDTAFHIDALGGFPGPYAAYALETIGIEGILALMKGKENRTASFVTAIAYADGRGIEVFTGRIEGRIVSPRGTGGFGYDPIFEWDHRTLAELPLEEKSRCSHRGRALQAFASWFVSERLPEMHKD